MQKCLDNNGILMYKYISNKGYTRTWSRKIYMIVCVMETNPLTDKIKDLNRGKMIEIYK